MNKRHYEHTLPNIRGSLSNTYGKNELHSLEGLKELEYYFKDYDIRIW